LHTSQASRQHTSSKSVDPPYGRARHPARPTIGLRARERSAIRPDFAASQAATALTVADAPSCLRGFYWLATAIVVKKRSIRARTGGVKIRRQDSLALQRWMRALPPATSASTSERSAIEVSPGVVMASAPWAAPYSTATCASIPIMSP